MNMLVSQVQVLELRFARGHHIILNRKHKIIPTAVKITASMLHRENGQKRDNLMAQIRVMRFF